MESKKVPKSSIKIINDIIGGQESTLARHKLKEICIEVKSPAKYTVNDTASRLIGCKPCRVSTFSKDGRGRAQKSVKLALNGKTETTRVDFRPWHLAFAYVGVDKETGSDVWRTIPEDREWSHRCIEENCIEVTHGLWETSAQNKDRWSCRNAAQVIVDGNVHMLCRHQPPCLNPKVSEKGSADHAVNLPIA